MSETFIGYLRAEHARLDRALADLATADESMRASLRQQLRIVEDQIERWTRDLSEDAIAA